jgi:hypothetical protein
MVAPMIATRGESHNVVSKGIVFIQFPHGEIIFFDDVLYILGIKHNLLLLKSISDHDL